MRLARRSRTLAALGLTVVVAGLGVTAGLVSPRAAVLSPVGVVTIDVSRSTHSLGPDFFGIDSVGYYDAHQDSAGSALALTQTPIRLVRFPGGAPGDYYDWRYPYDRGWSTTSPLNLWNYARKLGRNAHVLFQTNVQGHTPAAHKGIPAVNSAASVAGWVRQNKAQGIAAAMEVGNEEDKLMHSVHDPVFASYIKTFDIQAAAMHKASPGVKVYGPASTNSYYWLHLDSLGMFLEATGNRYGSHQVDGVSLHYYTGHDWNDALGAAQGWLGPNGLYAHIQQTISFYDTRALPVDISEWNLGNSDFHNAFTPTLGHALLTADMVGAFAQSGVASEQYFDIHGSAGWGLFYGDKEPRPLDSPTPTYFAMALWQHMGRQMLGVSATDDPASVTSVYASRYLDGRVTLLAINKLKAPRTIQVTFKGYNPRGKIVRVYDLRPLKGNGVTSLDALYDGAKTPNPTRRLPGPRIIGRVSGASFAYTLPAYSATVFELASR